MCVLILKWVSHVVTNCVNFTFWSRPAMRVLILKYMSCVVTDCEVHILVQTSHNICVLILKCMSHVVTDCEVHIQVQTSHACTDTEMHVLCGGRLCEVHILVQTSRNMCALILKCMSHVVTDCVKFVHRPISSENKGHRMLAKMGWKEGSGLGKDSAGRAEPVRIVFKNYSLSLSPNRGS